MENLYARWMYDWENRLCSVSTNRVVRPFDWGLEWARDLPCAPTPNGQTPPEYLKEFNLAAHFQERRSNSRRDGIAVRRGERGL